MHACLTEEELERLAADPAADGSALGCVSCRAALAALRADGELFRELRGAATDDVEPTPPVPASTPGAILGYTLEAELHRGGQGVVYAAAEQSTGASVALKVLLRGRFSTERERRRFEREIELAQGLEHPGIARVLASGTANGAPWYTMEKIDGLRLDEWVRIAEPDLRARLALFAKIADAVAYAHRRGVIHRDLKPGNVLVDRAGEPKLLDFGLAKTSTAGGERVTRSGEFLGTLAYAAPEQLRGGHADVDTQSDVYALGVMLYELVTGHLPYDVEGGIDSAIESITNAVPPDPRQRMREIDADLATLLLRPLAKEPERRYPGAAALARDVRHWLAGEPIEARADGSWYALRRQMRRHRPALLAGGAGLLLLALGIGAFASQRLEAAHARRTAEKVRAVFLDVIAAASPDRMGGSVTLVEVLADAAERIGASLDEAPDVQAEVQLAIGDTYLRLLMVEEAKPHLDAALERFRALDPRGLDVARCLERVGLCASHFQLAEGIAAQREALSIRQAHFRKGGEGHALVVDSEIALGYALEQNRQQRDPAQAEALYRQALEEATTLADERRTARAEHRLAAVLSARGATAEAEPLFRSALATLERLAVRDDPLALECANDYAGHLQRTGRAAEAGAMLARSAGRAVELYGAERAPEVLLAFATMHVRRGDDASAETLSRRALACELDRWAARRPVDAPRLAAMARLLEDADAVAPYREAFLALKELRGKGAYEVAQWMGRTATHMVRRGERAEAEVLLRESLDFDCRLFGRNCPVRVGCLEDLAALLVQRDDCAEAVPYLRDAVETRRRVGVLDRERGPETCHRLAQCLAALGVPPEPGGCPEARAADARSSD